MTKDVIDFKIIETFEFYDFPRLFLCKAKNHQFLALNVLENSETLSFLFLKISDKQINLLHQKQLDLNSTIRNSENGDLFFVNINAKSFKIVRSFQINPKSISEDFLPVK